MLSLTAICSFRTPVNYTFAQFTDRPYKVTEITYTDIIIIFYWIFLLIVFFVFEQTRYLPQFFSDANLVDTDSGIEIFAGNMIYQAEVREFRFDFVMAITAFLFCIKALWQFSFTATFGPLVKMIITMST